MSSKKVETVKQGSWFTQHSAGVTVYHNGRSYAASTAHPLWQEVLAKLKDRDIAGAVQLLDIRGSISGATRGLSRIKYENGNIVYKGVNGKYEPLSGPLIDKVLKLLKEDKLTVTQVRPLMLFMDNLVKNQLKDIREELYQFLMSGDMPITVDGCFLAYKKVRNDYKDIYTGTMDNSPGKVVAMNPEKVDRDRTNTCSTGLHFASRSYMQHYGVEKCNRTVVVKVNPRHVFAIPNDYNNAKGRASEYFVVGECTGDSTQEEHFLEPLIFDETKAVSAPKVKFIKSGLKASIEALAEGYGLSIGGRALVRVADKLGSLGVERYSIVTEGPTNVYTDFMTKRKVPAEQVKDLAVSTKSVRSALVRAVAKARKALR